MRIKSYYQKYPSRWGYYSGYNSDPSLEQNLQDLKNELLILRKLFPELAEAVYDPMLFEKIEKSEVVLPGWAERWTLLVLPTTVGKSYTEALLRILFKLNKRRDNKLNYHYYKNKLDPDHLQQSPRTLEFWEKISKQQSGYNICIVPVQLGICYQDDCIDEIQKAIEHEQEFGIDSFTAATLMITHPNRLKSQYDLNMFCIGDDYDVNVPFRSVVPEFSVGEDSRLTYRTIHTTKNADWTSIPTIFLL